MHITHKFLELFLHFRKFQQLNGPSECEIAIFTQSKVPKPAGRDTCSKPFSHKLNSCLDVYFGHHFLCITHLKLKRGLLPTNWRMSSFSFQYFPSRNSDNEVCSLDLADDAILGLRLCSAFQNTKISLMI